MPALSERHRDAVLPGFPFKNTIVIMTSNAGSQWIKELGGHDTAEMRRRVMAAMEQSFKPGSTRS